MNLLKEINEIRQKESEASGSRHYNSDEYFCNEIFIRFTNISLNEKSIRICCEESPTICKLIYEYKQSLWDDGWQVTREMDADKQGYFIRLTLPRNLPCR
jgi:hypothetical protein